MWYDFILQLHRLHSRFTRIFPWLFSTQNVLVDICVEKFSTENLAPSAVLALVRGPQNPMDVLLAMFRAGGVVFWGAVPESVAGLRQNGCDEIDGCPTKGLTAWGLSRDRIPEDVFLVSWSDAVHQEEHRAIGLAASVKRSVLTEEMIRLSSSFPSSPSPP